MIADPRPWRTRLDRPEVSKGFLEKLDVQEDYEEVFTRPLRAHRFVEEGKSLVTLAQADSREEAIAAAIELAGK